MMPGEARSLQSWQAGGAQRNVLVPTHGSIEEHTSPRDIQQQDLAQPVRTVPLGGAYLGTGKVDAQDWVARLQVRGVCPSEDLLSCPSSNVTEQR